MSFSYTLQEMPQRREGGTAKIQSLCLTFSFSPLFDTFLGGGTVVGPELDKVESVINVDFVVEDGSGVLAAVDKLCGNLFTLRALHIYFGLQKQVAAARQYFDSASDGRIISGTPAWHGTSRHEIPTSNQLSSKIIISSIQFGSASAFYCSGFMPPSRPSISLNTGPAKVIVIGQMFDRAEKWTRKGHGYWTLQTAETSHGEDQLMKYCLSLLHYGNQFDQHSKFSVLNVTYLPSTILSQWQVIRMITGEIGR
ncbi:hypothetical protein SADUNF_Sadunf06G0220200 [Salix dunnii]|uniref:Uncharacterized protein n=1 Tax=Salix dunnii TaxID=1413687 RepID=A0A835K2X9_9ROSI|nr:hypothetical protein SADUNF_Sadunf06G0220200 [Salix dunnii]